MRIQSKRITATLYHLHPWFGDKLTVYIDSMQTPQVEQAGASLQSHLFLSARLTSEPSVHGESVSPVSEMLVPEQLLEVKTNQLSWGTKYIQTSDLPNLTRKGYIFSFVEEQDQISNYKRCTLHQMPQTIPNRKSLLPELLTASDNLMKLQHDIFRERLDSLEWSFCWDLIKHPP